LNHDHKLSDSEEEKKDLLQIFGMLRGRINAGWPIFPAQGIREALLERARKAFGENTEAYFVFGKTLKDLEYLEFDTENLIHEDIEKEGLYVYQFLPRLANTIQTVMGTVNDLVKEGFYK